MVRYSKIIIKMMKKSIFISSMFNYSCLKYCVVLSFLQNVKIEALRTKVKRPFKATYTNRSDKRLDKQRELEIHDS